ncbi:chemotaxis protein CheW [Lederbergia lenta]|uniref:Chemotaxis protein CheW n=1 Tax=Lederbergia lenta TaxID=1467 RepID=A0A2X4WNE7_LEDLE|nr:chemotaxis protein CheW [Lederbergia lenta]MCM3110131.1 chemotaxis protein CheW [Lederbergia lenta]MEC2324300.1 chemotaxis protein CheW [Lederbergia lenta]SQI60212.1 CheW protein [Lederbergia lenta]
MNDTSITTEQKVIVFMLNGNEYALSVEQVTAIEKMQYITRVPKVVSFIKGVINLRGVIIPIIDLKKRFDLGDSEYTDNTRIIIVSYKDLEVGLIVDLANDVLDIPNDAIEPQPEVIGAVEAEFISGVAKLEKRLLILLNLENILESVSNRNATDGN